MYVLRVTLMYLTPFALGAFDYYALHRSLPFAAVLTVLLLGVTIWRREKAAAVYRAAVKDIEGIVREGRPAP